MFRRKEKHIDYTVKVTTIHKQTHEYVFFEGFEERINKYKGFVYIGGWTYIPADEVVKIEEYRHLPF
jgi:hypothetical protein